MIGLLIVEAFVALIAITAEIDWRWRKRKKGL